jgi:TolA-binding protein
MTRSYLPATLLAAVLATGQGCAWITQNQSATARYAQEVTVAQARTAEVERALADAESRLEAVERTIRDFGSADIELLQTVEGLNVTMRTLKGDVEKLKFDMADMKRSMDTAATDADKRMLYAERRLSAIETTFKLKPPPPPGEAEIGAEKPEGAIASPTVGAGGTASPTPQTVPTQTDVPKTVDDVMVDARDHLAAGRPGVARALLTKAIEENPKSPKTAELRYLLAESYFAEDLWGKSMKEYQAVVDGYPKSEWAAWALVHQGDVFVKKGQPEDARAFWEYAQTTYPKTDAAKEAKKRLSGK